MITIDKLHQVTIWDDISECQRHCAQLNEDIHGKKSFTKDWTYQMDMLYTAGKTRCRIRVLDENNKSMGYL